MVDPLVRLAYDARTDLDLRARHDLSVRKLWMWMGDDWMWVWGWLWVWCAVGDCCGVYVGAFCVKRRRRSVGISVRGWIDSGRALCDSMGLRFVCLCVCVYVAYVRRWNGLGPELWG